MGRNKKPEILKICETCKKAFFAPKKHPETKNCSPECRKIYMDTIRDDNMKKARKTIHKRYGVDFAGQIPGSRDKMNETKLKKAEENPMFFKEIADKAQATRLKSMEENPNFLEEIVEKRKATSLEKHGDENFNNREQANETILEKFGVPHHLQLEECLNKMKKTNLERHGVEWSIQSEYAIQKAKEKKVELFGVENYYSSEQHLGPIREKKLLQLKEILEKGNFTFDFNNYTTMSIRDNSSPDRKHDHFIKYEIKCNICGTNSLTTFTKQIPICRTCNPKSCSRPELFVKSILQLHNITFEQSNKTLIKPQELDLYVPDRNIAFEINGNYWHSEIAGERDNNYHLNKTVKSSQIGINLIHFFDDEIDSKPEIATSIILDLLNIYQKEIDASNCTIKEVTREDKDTFLNINHIEGTIVATHNIGLYYNEELVSIMTFLKHKEDLILNRFCNVLNTKIQNSFEILFNHFKNNYKFNKIISYSDCRFFGINPESTIFHKNGFKFVKQNAPTYFYLDGDSYRERFNRFQINKQSLLEQFKGDESKTEWELAQENGYDRIWDCGNLKFEYVK